MTNLTIKGRTYYARFFIPKDRWLDVGKALKSSTGQRRDVIRTLETRDRKEALRRRGAALEAIRAEVNDKLQAINLKPLHGDWQPQKGWSTPEKAVETAHIYREQIERASDDYDPLEGGRDEELSESVPETARERMKFVVSDLVMEDAERLPPAEGGRYLRTVMGIVDGTATPIGPLLDRWTRHREETIAKTSLAMDRAAFNLLATYMAQKESERTGAALDGVLPLAFLRSLAIEDMKPRILGGFAEWLMDEAGLAAKTTGSRISPLKAFWDWCIRKHLITGPNGAAAINPWTGATTGLKQQASRASRREAKRLREFSGGELMALLQADPDEGGTRRWAWGAAIRDLMRLALFTGARENELCSLTVSRIVMDRESGQAALWGIAVTDEEAKTTNSVRRIPLHPLVRPIIERRLAAALGAVPPLGEAIPLGELDEPSVRQELTEPVALTAHHCRLALDAPLFPECKPGRPGRPGDRRGYYFSRACSQLAPAGLGLVLLSDA
ncbi:site-specific integrase [Acetobacter conturbans]|uniref:Integrase n=1 Tax=Acetobacter conturbans TaxID=1737472 RepID=A0ABX0K7V1_9PROT|nr:hypothetical protein [Acetobacter conturbans]NHN90290.1 hypothetical protein [Acetobacter conturbans]